ncbi:MAG TPA: NAD(P)-dependent oxidoreductase [Steroidobacteraceae bacterium]|nr:NAD(P)-dependent oxidoreductase [Steroidobacteraceae bacterium]
MTRAVFLDYGSVAVDGDLDPARLCAVLPGLVIHEATPEPEVDARIAGAAVVLCNKARLTRARIAANRELKLIALTATGTNNVDLEAAREHGVAVCNITDYCTASVVQHVFAVLLALTHRLREYDRALKAGGWERADGERLPAYPVRELAGRTLGVVGYGTLGRGVARIAAAFGMRVLVAARAGAAPEPGRLALPQLLPAVDVLSLHCPITPATRGLIGARELALMKPDAVLINTARGGLVDAAALAAALRAGRLGGAAIDVLEEEPPVHGSPLLAPDLGNLIVTPHTAWAAREARQRAIDELAENAAAFLRGERRHRVV